MKKLFELIIKYFLENFSILLKSNSSFFTIIKKMIGFISASKLSYQILSSKNKVEILKTGGQHMFAFLNNPCTALSFIIFNLGASSILLGYNFEVITIEKINEDLIMLTDYLNQTKPYDQKDINTLLNIINENAYLKAKYLNLNVILSAEEFNHTFINTHPDLYSINQKMIRVDLETLIEILEKKKEALNESSSKMEIIYLTLSILLLIGWMHAFYNQ